MKLAKDRNDKELKTVQVAMEQYKEYFISSKLDFLCSECEIPVVPVRKFPNYHWRHLWGKKLYPLKITKLISFINKKIQTHS